MKYFQVCSVLLLVAASALGQYNYQKPAAPPAPPTTPRGTYLPPKNEQQEQIAAEGLSPDGEHEPGMPFDFTYAVKDDVGNDFSHNAESDGDVVKGEYRTLLPDGRLQIVKYTADWKNGYNAEITYEGEAQYPEPPKTTRAPAPAQRAPVPQTTRNPYLSDTDIDSQGLTPARPAPQRQTPGYDYQPPRQSTRPPPPPPRPQTQPPRPVTRPPPPPTTQRTTPPPPPGLYGAPSVPFGVRNNPKFGYSK